LTFSDISFDEMDLPWKGIGLDQVLVKAHGKKVLFINGHPLPPGNTVVENPAQVAYVGNDETLDVGLLARTIHPTLSDYSLSNLYESYGIERKDSPENLFLLFSKLIEDYLKLSPELLALLSRMLPAPSSVLLSKMVPFAKAQFKQQRDELDRSNAVWDAPIEELFSSGGPLAQDMPGFEAREGQREMAKGVLDALEKGGTIVVEAGAGTGKTFAYLIPALMYLREHRGSRLVISTRTKQLQEQIFYKDLPFLAWRISPSTYVSMLKGRNNYICLRRWQMMLGELLDGLDRDSLLPLAPIARWLAMTQTGDIEENNAFLNDPNARTIWRDLCDDPHHCIGKSCPLYDDCFSVAARRRARRADLVVVNHPLLLADQLSTQGFLGEYDAAIVDEAHALEEAARNAFTLSLSVHNVNHLLRSIEHPLGKRTGGWLKSLPFASTDKRISKARELALMLRGVNSRLFQAISQRLSDGRGRLADLSLFAQQMSEMISQLEQLARSIESLGHDAQESESGHEANGLVAETMEITNVLKALLSAPDENSVHWYEFIGGEPHLHLSPLSVVPFLEESLYSRIKSLVLTSATLSQGESFSYLEQSLGLSKAPQKVSYRFVSSPFCYHNEMKLLIPQFLPPVTQIDEYAHGLADCVSGIVRKVGQKTLVLFTSYKLLRQVRDLLSDRVTVLAQGIDGPRSKLIERFRHSHKRAVLLGTDSFWEGVDLPGNTLEILIITRLPFPVPSDPVFAALADNMAKEGRDPFYNLSVPRAILKLRQGVGRLIRTTSDYGIVIITDQRILSQGYGKSFTSALPVAAEKAQNLEELILKAKAWLDIRR
jgi:ATP-dependent DNA helicase DinG